MASYVAHFESRLGSLADPLIKKILNVPVFGSRVDVPYLSPPLTASGRLAASVKGFIQLMEETPIAEGREASSLAWAEFKTKVVGDLDWYLRRGELKKSLERLDALEDKLKEAKAFEALQLFRDTVNPHSETLLFLLQRAFLSDVPLLAEEVFRLAMIQSKSYTPRQLDTLQTARELCNAIWLRESAKELEELLTVLLKLKYPGHHGETLRELFSQLQELHDDIAVQELWKAHAGA